MSGTPLGPVINVAKLYQQIISWLSQPRLRASLLFSSARLEETSLADELEFSSVRREFERNLIELARVIALWRALTPANL